MFAFNCWVGNLFWIPGTYDKSVIIKWFLFSYVLLLQWIEPLQSSYIDRWYYQVIDLREKKDVYFNIVLPSFFHFNVENLVKHLCHRIIMLCWVILPQEVWRNVSKPSCWRCIIIYQGWVNRKIMLRQILNLFGIFIIYWSLGIITSFVNELKIKLCIN